MEHHNMHNNTAVHWSYGAPAVPTVPPQNHWGVPPAQVPTNTSGHGVKRPMSESDCEDLYSEESSKEQISPSDATGSCQLMSRKKRRGVIEKKRRDRINSSLSELKRLVPSAYEKQGSAKLEKAEILQLTVEHLKNLQSKGVDALSYDPQRFAMDYHIIGFRECAAEVARYLVTIEGMDIQDPLRLRLMSHLQYFVQQRELSAKGCASTGGWAATAGYQTNCAMASYQAYPATATAHATANTSNTSAYVPNLPAPSLHQYPSLSLSPSTAHLQPHQHNLAQHQHHQQQQQQQPQQQSQQQQQSHNGRSTSVGPVAQDNTQCQLTNQQTAQQQQQQQQQHVAHSQLTPTTHETHQHQQQQQQHYTHDHTSHHAPHQADHQAAGAGDSGGPTYIELTTQSQTHHNHRDANNALPPGGNLSYGGVPSQYPPTAPGQDYNSNTGVYVSANGSKPYRPWGAEMAY